MNTLQGFDFFELRFDSDGELTNGDVWQQFKAHAKAAGSTDAIFVAHGFRTDENDARSLYSDFLRTFRQNIGRNEFKGTLAGRKFLVAGVLWPSKAFSESFGGDGGGVQSAGDETADLEAARAQIEDLKQTVESDADRAKLDEALRLLPTLRDNPENQDRFVDLVLSTVDDSQLDANEGVEQIKAQPGSELLDKLRFPVILPTAPPDADEGGVASLDTGLASESDYGAAQGFGSFVGSIFGRVGQFLNLTTWYLMKNRSGIVGANGVAAVVRDFRQTLPSLKIHLAGHSLGGRLMAACSKSLSAAPAVKVDSLTLLQAAFSHFGLSADNRAGVPGFFRDVVAKEVVKGPIVATFSFHDEVVGKAYAIASRLAGDNVRAIGDSNDPFGGIGRNGAQNMKESTTDTLHTPGSAYTFAPKRLYCLDGSGGLIANHSDIRNETVTYAFASAVAST